MIQVCSARSPLMYRNIGLVPNLEDPFWSSQEILPPYKAYSFAPANLLREFVTYNCP